MHCCNIFGSLVHHHHPVPPHALAGYSKFAKHHFAAEGLYPPGTSTWLMFGAEVRINLLAF